MKKETFKIIGMNMLIFLVLLSLLEATGQVIALIHPSYDVLFLQPDDVVGWRQVPNLHWIWSGYYWYAADFSVKVETNPHGFRDITREFSKPYGVKRVALLGDSFIEALQVPFEKTAGQLLEKRLNSLERYEEKAQRWEVLNFGISNYGVGQYLLTWEQYARKYDPDYIAILVAKFHMRRTIDKLAYGAFPKTKNQGLWIRPTFHIENNALVRESPQDFDEFVRLQAELIETEFAGQRIRRKKRIITFYYAALLLTRFRELGQRFVWPPEPMMTLSGNDQDAAPKLLAVNLKIIEDLGRDVASTGSRLVVLDASRYFGDEQIVSDALNELCAKNGFGYIPLYEYLLKANLNGVATRWAHDGHFNETGNEILAKGLYDMIVHSGH